jgi:pullulanase
VNREDSVIYEVHVRDFTIDANSGVDPAKRGKYMGMVQMGTSFNGAKTGIDHLKELGITHVQLLPFYDFGSGMYNWGYDPVNYNVPEEQYSQATTPEGRIREFKDMVNEFHKNGIRVIMDVVYNHTFNKDVLQTITGKYYTSVDLSGTGNSIDDGNPMVSRMIRDSLEHWVRDYNIDGFRFDLIGVFFYTDVASWWSYLNSTYPDRNLLAYGEPWNGFASDPNDAQKVRLGKAPPMASAHVGVFNPQYREAIKGGNDDGTQNYMFNAAQDPGPLWWGAIAAGMRGSIEAVKSTNSLANEWDSMFAFDPEQSINYISAHDNFDLWDKINFSGAPGGATGYAGRVDRFGMGMILTSQGIPFIHAGDEFLRSKAFGGDYNTAKNSFSANDNYNMLHWADLVNNAGINKYYEDAIALRKATPALRLTTWDDINSRVRTALNAGANNAASINVVNDTTLPGKVVVSFISSNASQPANYDTVVVFNPGNNFNVSLPAGTWTKVFDTNGAVSKTDTVCEGTAVTVFKKN